MTIAIALLAVGLILFVAAVMSPSITRFDVFSKTNRFDLSISQLQKFYDWKIAQYSSIGASLLGGVAGFVASVVLEKLKPQSFDVNSAFYLGVSMTLFLVILVHLELRALRNGFILGYSSLERLSDVARIIGESTVEP
jgi:hypothetical protein